MRQPLFDNHLLEDPVSRGLACTVVALLICITLVNAWPLPSGQSELAPVYSTRGQEVIQIEEIVPTRQQKTKPPPPAPLLPIEVPDDVLLEEIEPEFDNDFLAIDERQTDGAETGEVNPLPAVSVGAKLVRMVEPTYTREAERKRVRAEVVVEVLVNERGLVQDARILERYLVGKDEDDRKVVEQIGFGLEESALEAARASRFRPAREGGQNVKAWTPLIFSFGVSVK